MSQSKKKCRQYNVDYLKFGFIPSLSNKQLPLCLICNKVFSNDAMKPSKLEDHLRRCHPDKLDKDLKYFQTLKENLQKRPTLDKMFTLTSQRNDDGFRASYNISLLIAKSGKPHTIGEQLILPAVEEVIKTVLHKPAFDIIKKIPLSNNSVQRRIDEMSDDIENFLCKYLQTTHFSIQLDESTLPGNEALLLAYVRFIMDQNIHEELLFARTLATDTKGESIFHVLRDYFIEKEIPLSNIISVATDGAPAMVGRYRGFISFLKESVPGVLAVHCVIHRQHLVAKNLNERLHESLQFVIDAVNRIRSNALNTRLFAQLCEDNDENFHQLLLHTNVRWLSKGLCLVRFFALFETVLEFLDGRYENLKESLLKRKTDIAYLTDLFAKFNTMNLQLQGDSLNLIKTKSVISAFLVRIKMMKQNIGRSEFSQFPNLSQVNCQEDDVPVYVHHLNALYSDFETRFEDILTLVIPQWIINPYGDIEEADISLQEELIGISTNEELKVEFRKGYQ
ncbi:SCAN domain-containing protein 3-like [Diorhabda sublineata]|uniref:SCAN domain-containing protein 3-like n=2 Tax=Diorhabda sublineata TaxID=1163346 RepID=UPI0024E167FA|nr:SCAN domain-containing protein 3-like [Diorhabda sublineata]XP_056647430.1 SCAN domain-containing protein 3-like [Diorhabda sublineata]XP_056647468.1 SCAN domain-containing protein 3-like [Diorhabda sublineata]